MLFKKNNFNNKKAQISIEALIAIGIIFFIFITVFIIYSLKSSELTRSDKQVSEHIECWKLSNSISGIYTDGDSSQITISIEKDLTVFPEEQRITTENTFCTLPINSISYGNSTSPFTLTQGDYTIKNSQGTINIE